MAYAGQFVHQGVFQGQQPTGQPQQPWTRGDWNAFVANDPALAAAISQHPIGGQSQVQQQQQQPRTHTSPGRNLHQPPMYIGTSPPVRIDRPGLDGMGPTNTASGIPSNSSAGTTTSTTLSSPMDSHYQTFAPAHPQHLAQAPVGPYAHHQHPQAEYQAYQPTSQHMQTHPNLRINSMPPHPYPHEPNPYFVPPDGWNASTSPPLSSGDSPTVSFSSSSLLSSPPIQPPQQQHQHQQQKPQPTDVRLPQQPAVNSGVPAASQAKKRKQATIPPPVAPVERNQPSRESDDDDEVESPVVGRKGGAGTSQHRACVNCKKAKVKCVPSGGDRCKRCQTNDKECTIEKRRPPRNPNRREYFLAQIREKDAIIESLLKELYNPYSATPLSVKTYRETAARTDELNASVRAWRERLEEGARPTAPVPAPLPSPLAREDGEEDEDEAADRAALSDLKADSALDAVAPVMLLRGLSINNNAEDGKEASDTASQGTSTDDVMSPRPNAGFEHRKSELLNHGLVNEADVDALFGIYHDKLNSFIPLLDPVLHTPREVFSRCPPLFSVICAITSRYYEHKSQIYPIAMHFAKNECSNALMHGYKSVELAQAFILLAFYSQPAKRWEEERGYVFGGLAMRMAIDLNLHVTPTAKPKTEKEEREQLNRLRLWMICFETDLNMAAHYGKPASLKENQIIRMSDGFYTRSEYVLVGDIGLAAYNKLLRVVNGFHSEAYSDPDSKTGLKKSLDFRTLGEEYDVKLNELTEEWTRRFAEYTKFEGDPIYEFRCSLLPYAVNYCRLVIFSFGFQQAFERGMQSSDRRFLENCMSAAKSVIKVMIEKLGPSKYMQFAPTGWFNFCAFASAFLIKLLRPEFSEILSKEEEKEIFVLVNRLVKTLASSDVAIDDRHAPKLWARFLEDLVAKRTRDKSSNAAQPAQVPTTAAAPQVTVSPPDTGFIPSVQQQGHLQQSFAAGMNHVGYLHQPQSVAVSPEMQWAQQQQQQQPLVGLGFSPNNGFAYPMQQPLFDFGTMMSVDEDATLAPMAALADQGQFWDNLMLPGFYWPDSPSSTGELPPVVDQTAVQPDAHQQWYTTQ